MSNPSPTDTADMVRLKGSPEALAAWRTAQQHCRTGRLDLALSVYRGLAQQYPGIPELWAEIGVASSHQSDFISADEAYQRAAELAGNNANLLVGIGTQFYQLRFLDKAFACIKRAVDADPSSVHARMTLASWLERTRKMDEAWETTEACLAQHPKEGRARYFKAFLLQRQGKNSEAETALRDLIKDPLLSLDNQANAWHLLGTVLDAVGQYKEAMESLKKSKALRRQTVNAAAMESNYDTMVASRQTLLAELKPEMVQRWREEAKETSCPHPLVLLGGPPRSGTTLFEQILAAHPEIIVFDEPHSFFNELLNRVNPPPPAPGLTLSRLNALTADERTYLIGRYLKSLLRETDEFPGAKLLLDKNPSTTGSLHLWIRLFPFSKNIIALRDPRDNVISCFFQNIPVSAANVSFLSLERTAQYYAHRMEVWLRMKELGGFEWIETRYEDIVRDLEGEGRRITSFLGLTWNDAQAKYYERARQKFVHSPTYDEVSKPVYKRAVGRWEHYAEELAPFQGILEPYLKHFGYA